MSQQTQQIVQSLVELKKEFEEKERQWNAEKEKLMTDLKNKEKLLTKLQTELAEIRGYEMIDDILDEVEEKEAIESLTDDIKQDEPENHLIKLPDEPLVIIFITGNKGKLREVADFVGFDIAKYIINHKVDLYEIQANEEEIVRHKLIDAKKQIMPRLSLNDTINKDIYVMVEDSSLILNQYSKKGFNFPGPFCKFAYKANGCQSFIDMVQNLDKSCITMSTFGLLKINENEEKPLFFKGECEARITDKERGVNENFPIDPIIEYIGNNKTFAEMTITEKNKISHTSKAMELLKQYIEINLIPNIIKQ